MVICTPNIKDSVCGVLYRRVRASAILIAHTQTGRLQQIHAHDRVGAEPDEVAGMNGAHRHPQFAVGLEAADPWAVSGARIDHHERAGMPAYLYPRSRAFRKRRPGHPFIDGKGITGFLLSRE